MKQYVEDKGFLYEINEKGERVLVRSTDSSQRAFIRFTNKTSREVDVWWRDFRGTRHHYNCLDPGTYCDINSFITHPWEFTDAYTKEQYVIDNTQIYRAPANIGGMMFRTNWNITVSVRTLRYAAMLVLAEHLQRPSCTAQLELPRTLETELQELIRVLHRLPSTED